MKSVYALSFHPVEAIETKRKNVYIHHECDCEMKQNTGISHKYYSVQFKSRFTYIVHTDTHIYKKARFMPAIVMWYNVK